MSSAQSLNNRKSSESQQMTRPKMPLTLARTLSFESGAARPSVRGEGGRPVWRLELILRPMRRHAEPLEKRLPADCVCSMRSKTAPDEKWATVEKPARTFASSSSRTSTYSVVRVGRRWHLWRCGWLFSCPPNYFGISAKGAVASLCRSQTTACRASARRTSTSAFARWSFGCSSKKTK